jgi:hypothetical protein
MPLPTRIEAPRVNRRVVNPIPAKYVDAIIKGHVWLINLTDQNWVFQRTYGVYVIAGTKAGEPYTSLQINGRIETMDIGDDKCQQQFTEAEDIADDLAHQANDGIVCLPGTESFMGVFVSPTEDPAPRVLAEMTAKLMAFYDAQIVLADQWWDDPATHKNISSLPRRAAAIRHQTRPWTYESVNTMACPDCGVSVRVGLAFCRECGAILDEQKAIESTRKRQRVEAATGVPISEADQSAKAPRARKTAQ